MPEIEAVTKAGKVDSTPGPWSVSQGGEVIALSEPSPTGNYFCCVAWHGSVVHRISGANARLIAAAPELLEALKNIAQMISDGYLVRNTSQDGLHDWAMRALPLVMAIKRADEAIQKAESK